MGIWNAAVQFCENWSDETAVRVRWTNFDATFSPFGNVSECTSRTDELIGKIAMRI